MQEIILKGTQPHCNIELQ